VHLRGGHVRLEDPASARFRNRGDERAEGQAMKHHTLIALVLSACASSPQPAACPQCYAIDEVAPYEPPNRVVILCDQPDAAAPADDPDAEPTDLFPFDQKERCPMKFDYYEVPETGFEVFSWCPAPKPTVPCTQVHLHIPAPGGKAIIRFKSPRTLDRLIEALIIHRTDVWGDPSDEDCPAGQVHGLAPGSLR